ncbi:hypothetical protein ACFYNO_33185 [Kitasatospora sp. NPDC006697]|uniref:hypothetical protein n=1 Tax=Kitasatospora sp. NPDC006697 TaxID=3364020 RepID=UPI00367C75E4
MDSGALPTVSGTPSAGAGAPAGLVCEVCGKPLERRPGAGQPPKYCRDSASCKSKARRRKAAAERERSAAVAEAVLGLVPLPAGLADRLPAGPQQRVLALAEAIAGAAYHYVATLQQRDGDPAAALERLEQALPVFAGRLLEEARLAAAEPTGSAERSDIDELSRLAQSPSRSAGRLDGSSTGKRSGPRAELPGQAGAASPGANRDEQPSTERSDIDRPPRVAEAPPRSGASLDDPQEPANGAGGTPLNTERSALDGTAAEQGAPTLGKRGAALGKPTVGKPRGVVGKPGAVVGKPAAPAAPWLPAAGLVPAYERGYGPLTSSQPLESIGPGWEMWSWAAQRHVHLIAHEQRVVGWVERPDREVGRPWFAAAGTEVLADSASGAVLWHRASELAAHTVAAAVRAAGGS